MDDGDQGLLVRSIVRTTLDQGGSTTDLVAGRVLPATDAWYFPRFPGRTRIVPLPSLGDSVRSFIDEHRETLTADSLWLGTWINPETRTCYLDLITRTVDEQEARALARTYSREGGRRIIAICNPKRRLTRAVWDGPALRWRPEGWRPPRRRRR